MVEIVSDLVGKTVEVRERYGNHPFLLNACQRANLDRMEAEARGR